PKSPQEIDLRKRGRIRLLPVRTGTNAQRPFCIRAVKSNICADLVGVAKTRLRRDRREPRAIRPKGCHPIASSDPIPSSLRCEPGQDHTQAPPDRWTTARVKASVCAFVESERA